MYSIMKSYPPRDEHFNNLTVQLLSFENACFAMKCIASLMGPIRKRIPYHDVGDAPDGDLTSVRLYELCWLSSHPLEDQRD